MSDEKHEQMRRAHSLASKLLARKGLMRPEELAELLGVSKLTVLRWAKKGIIPCVRIQNMVFLDPGNTARWLVAQGDRSEVVKPLK